MHALKGAKMKAEVAVFVAAWILLVAVGSMALGTDSVATAPAVGARK